MNNKIKQGLSISQNPSLRIINKHINNLVFAVDQLPLKKLLHVSATV